MLHGKADAKDDMMRAGDPDGAVGFEHALAALEPCGIEFVIPFPTARFVPLAFVHLHHFACMAGDAAVGEKIRRVGENHVEPAFGISGRNRIQDGQTVIIIKPDAVCGVFVSQVER